MKYCSCSPSQADRYWARLSGPLLDRIDLHVDVARLNESELVETKSGDTSDQIRLRVLRAADIQRERYGSPTPTFNGQLGHKQIRKFCVIDQTSQVLLSKAVTQLGLSARAYDRVLRIGRTIADLEAEENISVAHIAEALKYRQLSRAV